MYSLQLLFEGLSSKQNQKDRYRSKINVGPKSFDERANNGVCRVEHESLTECQCQLPERLASTCSVFPKFIGDDVCVSVTVNVHVERE